MPIIATSPQYEKYSAGDSALALCFLGYELVLQVEPIRKVHKLVISRAYSITTRLVILLLKVGISLSFSSFLCKRDVFDMTATPQLSRRLCLRVTA
jgi:hypothetical protein